MTHAEFHGAVKAIAAGKYCSTKVEVNTRSAGVAETYIEFAAYIDGRGWSGTYRDAASVLAELGRPAPTQADVEALS